MRAVINRFRPAVECLESRQLMSVTTPDEFNVVARGDDNGVVHNDTFVLRFAPQTHRLELQQVAGNLLVSTTQIPESVRKIDINGRAGSDTVRVEALPAFITLTVTDAENFSLNNLDTGLGIGSLVLTTTAGGPRTAATFDNSLDTYYQDIKIERNQIRGLWYGFPIDLAHVRLNSLTVKAGMGDDYIQVISTKAKTTVDSGGGSDQVSLNQGSNSVLSDLSNYSGAVTLTGGDAGAGGLGDWLIVDDSGTAVLNPTDILTASTFTRVGAVRLPNGVMQPSVATINYSGFETAYFNPGGVGGSVRIKSTAAGVATSVLQYNTMPAVVGNDANRLDDIRGPLSVVALDLYGRTMTGGTLSLLDQGSAVAHSYAIDNLHAREVTITRDTVPITAMQRSLVSLNAGSAADTFITHTSGVGYTAPTVVNGGGSSDTFATQDIAGAFAINGVDVGKVNFVTFNSVENLQGGNLDDTFVFQRTILGVNGRVDGRIDGGGGINKLDYSAFTSGVTVDLKNHSATSAVLGAFNIRNVTGSKGDDLIRGDDNANDLRGVDGNDILIGLGGNDNLFARGSDGVGAATTRRNLLIGGNGSDVLEGGEGEDILLGGFFENNLDLNDAVLRAFLNVWKGAATYANRTQSLNDTGVVINNTRFKVNDDNIHRDDDATDTLHGNGGLDWFWTSGEDIKDRVNGESENDV